MKVHTIHNVSITRRQRRTKLKITPSRKITTKSSGLSPAPLPSGSTRVSEVGERGVRCRKERTGEPTADLKLT